MLFFGGWEMKMKSFLGGVLTIIGIDLSTVSFQALKLYIRRKHGIITFKSAQEGRHQPLNSAKNVLHTLPLPLSRTPFPNPLPLPSSRYHLSPPHMVRPFPLPHYPFYTLSLSSYLLTKLPIANPSTPSPPLPQFLSQQPTHPSIAPLFLPLRLQTSTRAAKHATRNATARLQFWGL